MVVHLGFPGAPLGFQSCARANFAPKAGQNVYFCDDFYQFLQWDCMATALHTLLEEFDPARPAIVEKIKDAYTRVIQNGASILRAKATVPLASLLLLEPRLMEGFPWVMRAPRFSSSAYRKRYHHLRSLRLRLLRLAQNGIGAVIVQCSFLNLHQVDRIKSCLEKTRSEKST